MRYTKNKVFFPGFFGVIVAAFLATAPFSALRADETVFHFRSDEKGHTILFEGNAPLWQYNAEFMKHPRVPKEDSRCMAACYIHPLYGIDGEILTDDAPRDHYHHHGVFWNWPHVVVHRPDGHDEHYDTWTSNTRMKQLFLRRTEPVIEKDAAGVTFVNGWFIGAEVNRFERDANGKPVSEQVAEERVTVTTHRIAERNGIKSRAIDLDFVWTIGDFPISLRGAGGKSYGGLSIRFRPSEGKPGGKSAITVPEGIAKTDLPETPLPWADYTSLFHRDENDNPVGDRSGAAIFVAPDHPDFPPTWLTRYYGPLCLGWPGVDEQTFQPGEVIRLSYRIWIHDKPVAVKDLENAYDDYRRYRKSRTEEDRINQATQPPKQIVPMKELAGKPEFKERFRNDFTGQVGMKLTVREHEMIVSEIGRFFVEGNRETHRLALLDEAGNMLASTNITMRSTQVEPSGFQYALLEKPVTLSPDQTYYVVSRERRGGDAWYGREILPVLSPVEDARVIGIYQSGGIWHPKGRLGCSYGPLSLRYRLGEKKEIANRTRKIYKGARNIPCGYLLNERFWAINTYLDAATRKLSGWHVDAAGGTFTHQGLNEKSGVDFSGKFFDWFRLEDISETDSVKISHQIARQEQGRIVLEFRMKLDPPGHEGAAALLLDGNKEAFRFHAPNLREEFGVCVDVDLDRKTADVFLDGTCINEKMPLSGAAIGIDAVRFVTGKEWTGHVYLSPVEIHKGFLVNERFQTCKVGRLPDYWTTTGKGASVEILPSTPNPDVYSLKLDGSEGPCDIKKDFKPTRGALVTCFAFLLPEKKDGVSIRLGNDKACVWEFVTRNGNLETSLGNGSFEIVIENYRQDLWYFVKIKSDPVRKTSDVDVNGKRVRTGLSNIGDHAAACFTATIPHAEDAVLWIDDVQIRPFIDYPDDYVPEPMKISNGKILVGVQSCNLWREGSGYSGWQWITDDRDGERVPFLGFYDEGNPEVTDWQILWQAEHGIDFEIHCWYRSDNAVGYPIKRTPFDHEIVDGLMNARYKNMKKFMIMWESNLFGLVDSADFRKHVVPYWIEYFFKDPSYLKIDNKPVLSVYLNTLTRFEDPKAELDYLRKECQKSGFDGAIIWHENRSVDPKTFRRIAALGVDYTYAYTWGGSASDPRVQKRNNILQRHAVAAVAGLGMIPSVTNGFDAQAWANRRGMVNLMTACSYRHLLEWLVDDFQKTISEDELGSRIVLLGNWNEFGEGHYLMPGTYEGFGFLKAIRKVFGGKEGGRCVLPSETQQRRIDLLYPWDWRSDN